MALLFSLSEASSSYRKKAKLGDRVSVFGGLGFFRQYSLNDVLPDLVPSRGLCISWAHLWVSGLRVTPFCGLGAPKNFWDMAPWV